MRGRTWCLYVSDEQVAYALEVDSDYALDPVRGWNTQNVAGRPPLPRAWKPRIVVGQDQDGNRVRARVGSTAAPLWTGDATTFLFEGNDLQTHTATVLSRLGEKTARRP